MCECDNNHTIVEKTNAEKKYRLADFFNAHWEAYLKTDHPLITIEPYKAVSAMR